MDVICDLDGTVADLTHRRVFIDSKPKNYNAFFAGVRHDVPIKPVIDLVTRIHRGGARIIFCSGRPERTREDSIAWLFDAFPCMMSVFTPGRFLSPLYMRADNDYRPDDIIKGELLDRMIAHGYNPTIAIDDRLRVCKMWERRGILVLAINCGNDF